MVALSNIKALQMMLRRFSQEIARSELELTYSSDKKSPRGDVLRKRIEIAKDEERQLLEKLGKFKAES
jgi:hypothetical protein